MWSLGQGRGHRIWGRLARPVGGQAEARPGPRPQRGRSKPAGGPHYSARLSPRQAAAWEFDGQGQGRYKLGSMSTSGKNERMFDLRVVHRYIESERIKKEEYEAHLASLPDAAENVRPREEGGDDDGYDRPITPVERVRRPLPIVSVREKYENDDDDDDDYDDDDDDDDISGEGDETPGVAPAVVSAVAATASQESPAAAPVAQEPAVSAPDSQVPPASPTEAPAPSVEPVPRPFNPIDAPSSEAVGSEAPVAPTPTGDDSEQSD